MGRYKKEPVIEATTGIDKEYNKMSYDFDQVGKKEPVVPKPKLPISIMDVTGRETWEQRMLRMLRPMQDSCRACTMCELGRKLADDNHPTTKMEFDPHVFSNMNPSRWIVVGQNPGTDECLKGEPFVGQSGLFFNKVIKACGMSRDKFYITNTVRCKTQSNNKPNNTHVDRCEPFLRMELQLLTPILIITLGKVAFDIFCQDLIMKEWLGKIATSKKFGTKVYPVYHPSPMNMRDKSRKKKFVEDISKLCDLIRKYEDN